MKSVSKIVILVLITILISCDPHMFDSAYDCWVCGAPTDFWHVKCPKHMEEPVVCPYCGMTYNHLYYRVCPECLK